MFACDVVYLKLTKYVLKHQNVQKQFFWETYEFMLVKKKYLSQKINAKVVTSSLLLKVKIRIDAINVMVEWMFIENIQ